MDGELLRWLYHRLVNDHTARHTRRCVYPDAVIALACLWAAINNRSLRWAADRANWPLWYRKPSPGYSQLRRRSTRSSVRTLLLRLDRELTGRLGRSCDKAADGKPLVVSGFSRDPDATRGHVPGGFGRGYRLHAVRDAATGVIELAAVTGLHAGEGRVLRRMLRRADLRGCLLRADANYDSNRLYALTASRGGRLIAPRRKRGRGLGHHPQHPDRLRAIRELEQNADARRAHRRLRADIERGFADLCNRVGLFALPPSSAGSPASNAGSGPRSCSTISPWSYNDPQRRCAILRPYRERGTDFPLRGAFVIVSPTKPLPFDRPL